ncbi:uncharacterized protein MONBRDRAFT_21490 [Monosiga brevicollis MX1]|uniref:Trifunctional purine biosynthetic protein adenosine-3 n=1 Tax=Monosiga brevicollis TaxID=81824 RepID=A9UXN2_MONBE|nr:uncharacterized protein MONBRDRAFT_21490 [Monosiga brevicollis MX1]EDQ90040.1 predicted protein [Monosiga brevicollis MX1]|eukprot:XP_001745462.1 hypothetical protein [Monosiga brevicollis MX1]
MLWPGAWRSHPRCFAFLSRASQIELVVVGPEQPLADGLTDVLLSHNINCYGPTQAAAQLEASKSFAKDFMAKHGIPTARYATFSNADQATAFIDHADFPALVVKASGLAAGKGVVVAKDRAEAKDAARTMLDGRFGEASSSVVIEELLSGPEVSILAFCDGDSAVLMPPAQDHKRQLDGDLGPNTGGMGAYAPVPFVSQEVLDTIHETVFLRVLEGMKAAGTPYHGTLYAGLMLTQEGPRVLEFNCRFGDPETQARPDGSLPGGSLPNYAQLRAQGQLQPDGHQNQHRKAAACVVMASKGYPEAYPKGLPIVGLDANHQLNEETIIFHAGTAVQNKQLVTSGGRVLSVTACADDLEVACQQAYNGIVNIDFEGAQYRRDIAGQVIRRAKASGLTYKSAGVDIDAGDHLVDLIKPLAGATKRSGCDAQLGGFGGMFDLAAAGFKDPVLVSGTDGVGTKLKVAHAVDKHDTIGIDLVAMCANDVLTCGAEPLFFLDYLATGKLEVDQMHQVVQGVSAGCLQAGCALLGGETAEMPGMYSNGHYDVAGFVVGAAERDQILPRIETVKPGDVVLGLSSSGVHSNGYSLVRRLVSKLGLDYNEPSPFSDNQSLGEALLEPTRIYSRQLLPLIRKNLVKAMAHITGGGLPGNVVRVLPDACTVRLNAQSWPMPPVFQWISTMGQVEAHEMSRTFNCGLGMVIVVDAAHVAEIQELLPEVMIIGSVEARGAEPVVVRETCVTMRKRVAVLISGTGTNLQALIDASSNEDFPAEIALVISNKPGVKGLERASAHGIPSAVVHHKEFDTRETFEQAIQQHLEQYKIDLVCLAGFMRILTPYFVNLWKGRLLNTHPALLPAFKGMHGARMAIEAGVRISGCTVHFVEAEVDAGAIVCQRAVPVFPSDDEDTLQDRIKTAEHEAYPEALQLVASGRCSLGSDGRLVWQQ